MASKQRFYVVWTGRTPGIYKTWDECRAQVEGYPGAVYRAYRDLEQAQEALADALNQHAAAAPERSNPLTDADLRRIGRPIAESYAVDAACSGNPGTLEYRCVHVSTGAEVFRQGPYENGTNNIGEFLAVVHALALFARRKITSPIYSDSDTALAWLIARKCGTKLEPTNTDAKLFQLIERAETWLVENDYQNRVLKWWTSVWGENPADFGRK